MSWKQHLSLLFAMIAVIGFGMTSTAEASGGSATIVNTTNCGTNVTIVSTAGITYGPRFVAGNTTVVFPFASVTECASTITANGVTVAQPQFAFCVNIQGLAFCPGFLCLTATPNTWELR